MSHWRTGDRTTRPTSRLEPNWSTSTGISSAESSSASHCGENVEPEVELPKVMTANIDFSKVTRADQFTMDPQEQEGARALLDEATGYLQDFPWVKEISQVYVGLCYPGIVDVFPYQFVPAGDDVPDCVWVVVGDLPPAYLNTEPAPNAAIALSFYIGAMEQWVKAVREDKSVEELIPVNVPPTLEYADMLGSRLEFLDQRILSDYAEDLKA